MNVNVEIDSSKFEAAMQALVAGLENLEVGITNDVFYVPKLEYGSSQQAPYGMVRISVREISVTLAKMLQSVDWAEAITKGTVRVTMVDRFNRTADYGMQLIRDRTPIRTGRARRGWRVIEAQ